MRGKSAKTKVKDKLSSALDKTKLWQLNCTTYSFRLYLQPLEFSFYLLLRVVLVPHVIDASYETMILCRRRIEME